MRKHAPKDGAQFIRDQNVAVVITARGHARQVDVQITEHVYFDLEYELSYYYLDYYERKFPK